MTQKVITIIRSGKHALGKKNPYSYRERGSPGALERARRWGCHGALISPPPNPFNPPSSIAQLPLSVSPRTKKKKITHLRPTRHFRARESAARHEVTSALVQIDFLLDSMGFNSLNAAEKFREYSYRTKNTEKAVS